MNEVGKDLQDHRVQPFPALPGLPLSPEQGSHQCPMDKLKQTQHHVNMNFNEQSPRAPSW